MTALIWPSAVLLVTGTLAFTFLAAWRGWLAYKRFEIAARRGEETGSGARIELADVRERLRKLEAIATGVDP